MKHSDQFLLATICRSVQGVAALAIVLASAERAPAAMSSQAAASLAAATVLSALGLGVAADRWLSSRVGIRSNCVTACLLPLLGLALAAFRPHFETLLVAAAIAGLGTGSEWSGVSELARRSLPVIGRWRGMCLWTVAFAVGSAVAVLLSSQLQVVFVSVLLLTIIATVLLLRPAPPHVAQPLAQADGSHETSEGGKNAKTGDETKFASLENRPEDFCDAASSAGSSPSTLTESLADAGSTANADCDAVECCGGQLAVVRPAAFGHGVLLIASVSLMFWGGIVQIGVGLNSCMPESEPSTMAFAVGIPVGCLLLHSVAPHVGYAIATLPFLLCGILSFAAVSSPSLSGPLLWLTAFAAGMFPAAAVSGLTAVIGEQFSDCGTNGTRTRVLSVGLFAASAVLIVTGGLSTWISPATFLLTHTLVFVAALLLLRRLPSPMISSSGSDNDNDPEDAELREVMASLSNRNELR